MSGLLVARRGSLNPRRVAAPVGDAYADEVLADSPFAWWRFEETSGSTVADEVGSNDGTVFGANLDVAGQVGSGASFDGVDDYINVGSLSGLSWGGSNGFTVEMLVNTTDSTSDAMFFGAINTSGTTFLNQGSWSRSGGFLTFAMAHPGTSDSNRKITQGSTAAASIADGAWHHLAFVAPGGTAALKIYLDGVDDTGLVRENASVSATSFPSSLFLCARNFNGSASDFNEAIQDEVAIYDKALSAARILAHAQAAGVASPPILPDENTPIGTPMFGGFFAGIIDTNQPGAILPEDQYQTPLRYALIVAPRSLQIDAQWRTASADVNEAKTRWDGLAAQEALVAPGGNTTFPAFNHCHGLTDFGGDDPTGDGYGVSAAGEVSRWYLPALDELTEAYWRLKPTTGDNSTGTSGRDFPDDDFNRGELFSSVPQRPPFTAGTPEQTDVTDFQEGGDQEFIEVGVTSRDFWSASWADSDRAWSVVFTNGTPTNFAFGPFAQRVRPFRRVVL